MRTTNALAGISNLDVPNGRHAARAAPVVPTFSSCSVHRLEDGRREPFQREIGGNSLSFLAFLGQLSVVAPFLRQISSVSDCPFTPSGSAAPKSAAASPRTAVGSGDSPPAAASSTARARSTDTAVSRTETRDLRTGSLRPVRAVVPSRSANRVMKMVWARSQGTAGDAHPSSFADRAACRHN